MKKMKPVMAQQQNGIIRMTPIHRCNVLRVMRLLPREFTTAVGGSLYSTNKAHLIQDGNTTDRSRWMIHTQPTRHIPHKMGIPPTAVGGWFIPNLQGTSHTRWEYHRPQSVDDSYPTYKAHPTQDGNTTDRSRWMVHTQPT